MQLHVSAEAASWYKDEMGLKDGEALRIFVKLYGSSKVHPNYSLGVTREEPRHPTLRATVNGVTFFVEEQDDWFVNGYDLRLELNQGEIDMEMVPE